MKKSLSLILALALVISMFASVVSADTAAPATPQEAFDALKAAGVVSGDAVKGANLDANMTRAEFSIVIAKLWSLPEFAEGSTVYSDLTGADWAKGSIGAATKAGLLDGVGDGKFNPSGNVKLEEIAKVIATGFKLDTTVAYAGAGKVDKWAAGYIAAVIKANLVADTADFTKAAKRSELFTISLAGYKTILAMQPVLNAAKFAGGVDKSIDIPKVAIKIDGTFDDWSGVKAYDVKLDIDGKALKHPGSIQLAWDGKSTMYAKGIITGGATLLTKQPVDGAEWWNDDAFEIFLNSKQPKDESENKALTAHYGINSIQAFTSNDLHPGTIAKSLPYKDGTWTFEASYPIDEDNLVALKAYGSLLGRAGVELNSTGEVYQIGRTGGFWDTDNFVIFKFLQTAGTAPTATPVPTKPPGPQPVLNAAKFAGGVDKSIDIPKAAIKIDGTFDDWSGVKAYDVKLDIDGKALKHLGSIQLAWDGKSTMYAKGIITGGDTLLAKQPVDGAEWWNDDAFEIFLNSKQPKDESENKALTAHYGINSIQAFTSNDLHPGTIAKSLPYKDGTWTFEASYPIDEDNLVALNAYGSLIGRAGVELNSTGEVYQIGRTGGFWDTDNFIIFKFLP